MTTFREAVFIYLCGAIVAIIINAGLFIGACFIVKWIFY